MSDTSYDRRTAAGKFDLDTVQQIKQLTRGNNHTEALLEGAKMLGLTLLVKKITLVVKLQDLEGYMPQPLGLYRNGLYDAMMEQAKRTLKPEEFEQFHSSF